MADINASGSIEIASGGAADGSLLGALSGFVPFIVLAEGNITGNPRVSDATPRSHLKIRVTFNQPMTNDSRLVSPANYVIAAVADGVSVFVTSVVPDPASTFPSFVDLNVNEMTDGEGYQIQVNPGASSPVSQAGLPIIVGGSIVSFTGQGVNPTVVSVAGVDQNLVEIKFSENMLDNVPIRDPANYAFDGGLTVTAVLDVVGDTVRLVTSDQTPGLLYNLVIG